jgi:hypothetical protein
MQDEHPGPGLTADELTTTADRLRHTAREICKLVGFGWLYDTADAMECSADDVGTGPVGRHRDSDALAESNFRVILADLQAVDERVRAVRFGHWACGRIEEIAVPLDNPETVSRVAFWRRKLDGYPIADDMDYAELAHEHAVAATATARYCHQCGKWVSAVLAILDEPRDSGWICDACGDWILCDECGAIWSEAHDGICPAQVPEVER